MKKIFSDVAPAAIGPYAQAVRTGNLMYCSGQTPVHPVSMEIESASIEAQTRRVIQNLEAVLQGAGLALSDIVKTNVYLTNMEDFDKMNAVYANSFGAHRPARTTVAVKGLPLGALIEMECIAEFKSNSNQ